MIMILIEPATEGWTLDYRHGDVYRVTSYVKTPDELRASVEGMMRHIIDEREHLHVQAVDPLVRNGITHHLGTGGVCLPVHPHTTCIDVSQVNQQPGTAWVCGPDCPPLIEHERTSGS